MNIGKALLSLRPGAEWVVRGTEIEWLDKTQTQPSDDEIQAKIEELKNAEPMRLLRLERNQKLTETDWWCCSDRKPTKAQLNYRTALRDLPSTASPSLDDNDELIGVNWPTKPE
tara:strand:+ start:802 stop:1143 length:342 start_codon:yes stop_codon:yes gene_type:complete